MKHSKRKLSLLLFLVAFIHFAVTAKAQLIQHLDASVGESIITDTTNTVTQWNDLSSSGNNGIPYAGKVYRVEDRDLTWIDFGVTRNALQLFSSTGSSAWLDQSAGTGGFCIFLVFKINALHTDWNDLIGNTSTALGDEGFGMRFSSSGSVQNYITGIRLEGSSLLPGEIVIFALNYDASADLATFWDSKLNAVISKTVPHTDFSMATPVTLGTTTNNSRFFNGLIGEVKIYDMYLSETDFLNEQEYLFNKWLVSENDPPLPDPATFEAPPATIYGTTISMLATTGTDANGGVMYYFEETTGNPGGDDSGWQIYPYYSDGGLVPGTTYSYSVTMRDAFGNVGESSQQFSAVATEGSPWINDLDSGAYYGYQAWHRGPEEGWPHWFDNGVPDAAHMSGDNWPDLSEYTTLYETQLKYPDGSPVSVYSTSDYETVDVHIRWMKEYGIKGCFVQRQQLKIDDPVYQAYMDRKAMYVRRACEKYGVKFCIMPCNNDKTDGGRGQEYIDAIIADWKHCVDDLKILESPMYMHQDGKPVIGFWGLGFSNRDMTVAQATQILDFFQSPEDLKYKVYLMGGLHHSWRTNPKEGWMPLFERLDMISPWRTIFYDAYSQNNIDRMCLDKAWCDSRGIDYNPVVSPGASTAYQNGPEKRNNYPRNGGHYLWKQVYEVCRMGSKFMYVAMYDEIDEGTAMYKLAENQAQCPVVDPALVPLDEDGYRLPSDWFLRIGTEMQKMMDGSIPLTEELPIHPFEFTLEPTPQDNSTGITSFPVLSWSGTSNADRFKIYLRKDTSAITENDLISTQTESSFQITSSLENGATYYWRVDAVKGSWIITGDIWNFTVEPVGTNESYTHQFQVYPNPATDEIFISGTEETIKYSLYEMTGNKLFDGILENNESIQIKDLKKGLYILSVQDKSVLLIKN